MLHRRLPLPVSGAQSKGIFSVHQCRPEIAHEYKCGQQSQHECDGFPGNEDNHGATSGEEGQLARCQYSTAIRLPGWGIGLLKLFAFYSPILIPCSTPRHRAAFRSLSPARSVTRTYQRRSKRYRTHGLSPNAHSAVSDEGICPSTNFRDGCRMNFVARRRRTGCERWER